MSRGRAGFLVFALLPAAFVDHAAEPPAIAVSPPEIHSWAAATAAELRFVALEWTPADTAFGELIQRLSEPSGYFDTDNLISNESSYLHVMGALERNGVHGGAYLGVGPDQNFSYIAEIRPELALLIDIRRDNLLQHLLFKALFAESRNRLEYLGLLIGRRLPENLASWSDRSLEDLVEYLDRTPPDAALFESAAERVAQAALGFGFPLSTEDLATIRRFHGEFHRAGLDLRFTSHGRGARYYYPTYRQLLLETDLEGRRRNYLIDEERFRFLKDMHRRNAIVPLVGDLAGDHALLAIADYLQSRGLTVSAFYTSNVEFYLMGGGTFDRWARNLARLPYDSTSVIIRSYFGRGYAHPQSVPGYYSTQLLQRVAAFVADDAAGGYRSYADLVLRATVEPRPAPAFRTGN